MTSWFVHLDTPIKDLKDFIDNKGINSSILLTGFTHNQFKFNYSYDISTARLMTHTGGAHEVSLLYMLKWANYHKKMKRRAVPCPQF